MKTTCQPLPQGLLILALGLAIMMARTGEAAICETGVRANKGKCDAKPPNGGCYKDCIGKHPGGQASCHGVVCNCLYECPPINTCNLGLGRCTASCDDQCCKSKCAKAHSLGSGYCDDTLIPLCICQYPC